jgi:hypothetical protein
MRLALLAILLLGPVLAGCAGGRDDLDDFSSSVRGGVGRDTYGTQRRVDVYGGSTAPTLPTMGATGYGK